MAKKHIKLMSGTIWRWTILGPTKLNKCHSISWLCRCSCGTERYISGTALRSGTSKSCGCYAAEVAKKLFTTHGQSRSGSRTYEAWRSMNARCRPHSTFSENYFDRGILVCAEWIDSFENFNADMGEVPAKYELERINNNKGYYKANCRWATHREQMRNTRQTNFVTYNGVTLPMRDWATSLDICESALKYRIKHWSDQEKIFTSHPKSAGHTKKMHRRALGTASATDKVLMEAKIMNKSCLPLPEGN